MANNATRRSLLKAATGVAAYGAGVAALSAGAAIVTADDAKGATGGVSPELTRLIAITDQADKAWADFCDGPWEASRARYQAMVVHLTPFSYRTGVENVYGVVIVWEERVPDITAARKLVDNPKCSDSELRQQAEAFLRVIDERKAIRDRAAEVSGHQASVRHEAALGAEYSRTQDAVLAFPSATIADLAAKIDFAEKRQLVEAEPAEATLTQIIADVRRLAGREG